MISSMSCMLTFVLYTILGVESEGSVNSAKCLG